MAYAEINYPVTPIEINQQISDRSLEEVYQELFSDQTAANMVLLAIDSGTEQWLHLATKFKAIEHPRTQSMLTMSVGEALQWSTKTVLGNKRLLDKFPLQQICSVEGLYEWRRFSLFLTETALNRRLAAVTAINEFALEKNKAKCFRTTLPKFI